MAGQQHSGKKLLHLVHLEAEPALPEEEGGVCECQCSAAGRCGNALSVLSVASPVTHASFHDLIIFV